MKNRIVIILILMSVCVAGITGLQLFWNYQHYKSTVKTFSHDINEALRTAVTEEITQRHQQIITKFKGWLADSSFVQISCDNKNRKGETVFHLKDTHPYPGDQKTVTIGLVDFKEKLQHITPKARKVFINHFGDKILLGDLQRGNIYYYTQRLGDSLSSFYDQQKLNLLALNQLYKRELRAKGIQTPFKLNTAQTLKQNQQSYQTQSVNTALRRPYQKELVTAAFPSPDTYFMREMKWLIVSSFLLICITLYCFVYTSRTLLSQHKLARLKDDFINNMTHEINTPLASIAITAEALKKFNYNQDTQRGYLDIITYQTEKLTTLAAQILKTSTLEKQRVINRDIINLNELIQKAVNDMSAQINQAAATLHYTAVPINPIVHGEAKDLLNAFTNIIDNALKYTKEPAVLEISLKYTQHWAEISFADQGIGIPAIWQTKIFDQFFRIPTGNSHPVKGYGLGLNYVKQVVQQHKGTISILPDQLEGSTFIFKLPIG